MNAIVQQALEVWGMLGASYALVAERENSVFQVYQGEKRHALRLHRPGYRRDRELASELEWMAALARGGVSVPDPIANTGGAYLAVIDGVQVDMLSWLAGETLTDCLERFSTDERSAVFFDLGREMARTHLITDAWAPSETFERVHWDIDGLLGNPPVWDRFWDNPGLTLDERALLVAFRTQAQGVLAAVQQLDYGLIHADLVPANVLWDNGTLRLIDFDDGGWGCRLFDVATALLKHRSAPQYPELEHSLLSGYRSERSLDTTHLQLFLCLRALTYVGWNIVRMHETGGEARNARFIRTAVQLCSQYRTP
ncbi:MAG: phosphotransferase [Marinovum sp.]|nr:phosphotransferase [Marinovum sp.]